MDDAAAEDLGWTEDWVHGLFDPGDRHDRLILQLAKGEWATYMRIKLALLEGEERLGVDFDEASLRRPVERAHELRQDAAAYLQEGGRLNDAPAFLGVGWVDLSRAISNGHVTALISWNEERVDAFELDVREGVSIRQLQARYGLTYGVTRTLVKMFRDVL